MPDARQAVGEIPGVGPVFCRIAGSVPHASGGVVGVACYPGFGLQDHVAVGIVLVVPGPVVLDEAQVPSGGVLVIHGVLLVPIHVRRGAVAVAVVGVVVVLACL